MEIVVRSGGLILCLYNEQLSLGELGPITIARASYIEPDLRACWTADLSPVGGPHLGSFPQRSQALAAETAWLNTNLLGGCADEQLPAMEHYEVSRKCQFGSRSEDRINELHLKRGSSDCSW